MKILGIETSCDETAVAVVEDGHKILSNIVSSQIDIHRRFGGIVPEVASRQHVIQIMPIVRESLTEAGLELRDVDAIAVTNGPGLIGALLVGVNLAKALSLALEIPLVGINHLEGHIYSAWISNNLPEADPGFPLICLIASGGHTDLVLMKNHGEYSLLGRTRDDAAGEAFDKAARILGLGFPGGPEIQKAANGIKPIDKLPRAWIKGSHDFSFSGIKTALLHKAQTAGIYPQEPLDKDKNSSTIKQMSAAFQDSVVDVLTVKTLDAAKEYKVNGVILGGGVTANLALRANIQQRSEIPIIIPPPSLCTDNGAMIAACGYFHLCRGLKNDLDLGVNPALSLG